MKKQLAISTWQLAFVLGMMSQINAQTPVKEFTASELKQRCDASMRVEEAISRNDPKMLTGSDETSAPFCLGFLVGVTDTLIKTETIKPAATSSGVTPIVPVQLVHIFIKYLANHPEQEQKPAVRVVFNALLDSKIYQ